MDQMRMEDMIVAIVFRKVRQRERERGKLGKREKKKRSGLKSMRIVVNIQETTVYILESDKNTYTRPDPNPCWFVV